MKSYIISLSKIPPSINTAMKLKEQLESFDMPVELFEGTYGTDAVTLMEQENRQLHPFGIKGPSITLSGTAAEKMQTPGVKGCFYSHYNLWKKCADLNEPILIWEDDIVLTRPYKPVTWKDVLVVALGHPNKSGKYMHYLTNPSGNPAAVDYSQSSMPGCCGYALQPHAARKLIKTYANTYLPADNAINQYHVLIEIHNHVMGIALAGKAVKKSLTLTRFWDTYNKDQ